MSRLLLLLALGCRADRPLLVADPGLISIEAASYADEDLPSEQVTLTNEGEATARISWLGLDGDGADMLTTEAEVTGVDVGAGEAVGFLVRPFKLPISWDHGEHSASVLVISEGLVRVGGRRSNDWEPDGVEDILRIPVSFSLDCDLDGDGVEADECRGEDCDDSNADVLPGVSDGCNGIDDDCDGETDEDETFQDWYLDADGDGYGDPWYVESACAQPSGYAANRADCDDSDAEINPAATELCNGIDDDCNGYGDPDDAPGGDTWWVDADGDGYGWADDSMEYCAQPSGYVDNDDDCDDTSLWVSPAETEVCDGVDNDCDGDVDSGADDASTWYLDSDGDGYGDAASTSVSCEMASGYVADAEDCDDSSADVNPGAAEICNEIDDDCDGLTDFEAIDAGTWYIDDDGDGFGSSDVSWSECSAPTGFVADDTDCDDSSAEVNPDAEELCDSVDNDCDGDVDGDASDADTWFVDDDGDGFGDAADSLESCSQPTDAVDDSTDCDDSEAEVNPDAVEVCDGIDNDCDGDADGGASDAGTWYTDLDGDGFGDPDSAEESCSAVTGAVEDGGDCDDGDTAVHPGADEDDCTDPVDYNCDGSVGYSDADGDGWAACEDCDDSDASRSPETLWYADDDGDGYGDASATTQSCEQPSAYVADSSDCDDTSDSVSPAASEVCNSVDDDCNGLIDDGATDADTWYLDADEDGYGDASATAESCSEPTGYVGNSEDCDDSDLGVNPDAEEICDNGIDDDCDGGPGDCGIWGEVEFSSAHATLVGDDYLDEMGSNVARAGDVNGDGVPDVLLSSSSWDSYTGLVHLVFGPVTGVLDLGDASATFSGEDTSDQAGFSLAAAEDVNADGYGDVLVGAPGEDTLSHNAGAAYLLLGPVSGFADLSAADAKLTGATAYDYVCAVAGPGDLSGDGLADLAIGASGYPGGSTWGDGTVALWLGPVTGTTDLSTADFLLYAESTGSTAGSSLSAAGDVNGDGTPDLLIGDYLEDSGGAAYLVLGPVTASFDLSGADARFAAEDTSGRAASCVADAGDVDGDGHADLFIGDSYDSSADYQAGTAYLVLGPVLGNHSLAEADAKLTGEEYLDYLGSALAGAGDVDGDGHDDLLLGAGDKNIDGAYDVGRAYLVLGPVSGTLSMGAADAWMTGSAERDEFGVAVAGPGDLDSDGYDDILVGAPVNDDGGYEKGTTYLFRGGGI